jgi:hypothetical protein
MAAFRDVGLVVAHVYLDLDGYPLPQHVSVLWPIFDMQSMKCSCMLSMQSLVSHGRSFVANSNSWRIGRFRHRRRRAQQKGPAQGFPREPRTRLNAA